MENSLRKKPWVSIDEKPPKLDEKTRRQTGSLFNKKPANSMKKTGVLFDENPPNSIKK